MTQLTDIAERITCIADRAGDITIEDLLGTDQFVKQTRPWSEFKAKRDWLHDSCILSHLITADYDGMDLCKILSLAHYKGRVIFVGGMLPRPAMVLRELKQAFPSLNIELHQAERFITLYELGIARGRCRRN